MNNKIFIISNEPWGNLWFSKQHYANELSKLGYRVYFVNAPTKWRVTDLFSFSVKERNIKDNLSVLEYHNLFPVRFFQSLMMKINDKLNYLKIKRKFPEIGESIMWTFDPLRFIYSPLSNRIIYHIADPYMSLLSTKRYHPILEKKATKMICTSPHYMKYLQEKGYKNILLKPHAISEDEYNVKQEEVEKIKNIYGDFILLVGTLNDDVDFNLIDEVTNTLNVNYLILGKDNETKSINDRIIFKKNLHYLGVVHAQQLKSYIKASKVCVTSYKFNLNKGVGSRSPLKILNYLAQFKPVVTSIDSEISELENQVIYRCETSSEYIDLIKMALKGDIYINKKAVQAFLNKRTYTNYIKEILDE